MSEVYFVRIYRIYRTIPQKSACIFPLYSGNVFPSPVVDVGTQHNILIQEQFYDKDFPQRIASMEPTCLIYIVPWYPAVHFTLFHGTHLFTLFHGTYLFTLHRSMEPTCLLYIVPWNLPFNFTSFHGTYLFTSHRSMEPTCLLYIVP